MEWVFWIYNTTRWFGFFWVWSGFIANIDKKYNGKFGWLGYLSRRFISETKPFYFLIIGAYYVSLSIMDKVHWYTSLLFLWDVLMYYVVKDHSDDSWKRRMEKLLEKIKVTEGKLVVVPN